jgi:DNA-binding transcriptional LysR family regulator
LGKTQSAISQAVAALEAELGQALFLREARAVRLTEAGRVLLHHTEQVFAELEAAAQRLAALSELRAGHLTLGTSDTLAYYALPPALAAFRAAHPGVDLTLETRPSPATALAVAAREVDLGVVTLPLPAGLEYGGRPLSDAVRIAPLGPEPDVLILPRGHALARRKRVPLAALEDEPLLLLGRDSAGRAALESDLARAGLRPRVAMEMNSVELLKRLTELGFGVAVVPRRSVAREVAAGVLASTRLTGLSTRRSLALVRPCRDPIGPAASALAELVEAHVGTLAERRRRRLS